MEWAIFGSAFVISFVLIVILGEHLRQRRKIALREIIQKERLAALEKGVQLPQYADDLLQDDHLAASNSDQYKRKVQWFRFTSLSVGLILIFGGLGMILLHLSSEPWLTEMASLGAIPFMAGLGLTLFYFLTRGEAS